MVAGLVMEDHFKNKLNDSLKYEFLENLYTQERILKMNILGFINETISNDVLLNFYF